VESALLRPPTDLTDRAGKDNPVFAWGPLITIVHEPLTVVGGAGFVGSAVVERCRARGREVVSVDRVAGRHAPLDGVLSVPVDLLTDPLSEVVQGLPPGPVVFLAGNSDPRSVRPWQLVLDNAVAAARVLPMLGDRNVTLVSSVEVYGTAPGPQREDTNLRLPLDDSALRAWNADAVALAAQPCPPWRAERLCRRLTDGDPSGRWVYAMAKRAQELLAADSVPADRLTVLRVANLFGPGQDRVVARLARRAVAGLPLVVTRTRRTFLAVEDLADAIAAGMPAGVFNAGAGSLDLVEIATLVLDALGLDRPVRVVDAPSSDAAGLVDTSRFQAVTGVDGSSLRRAIRSFVQRLGDESTPPVGPPIPVVVPPRPEQPGQLSDRIQQSLWTGTLKDGPWTAALTAELRARLELPDDLTILPTSSGTAALRLATVAVAGRARPGDVAVLPSFTFPATGEYLAQLGYRLRYCDVRPDTWTLDPARLDEALAGGDVRVVVVVDALGAPSDYGAIMGVCRRHGVPVVADSAPSLGGRSQGRPVGSQADAHAFSMSFAKVVSAAGGGGVVVLPTDAVQRLREGIDWTRSTLLGEVHAAAALDLVEQLDRLLARRRAVADVYAELERADPRVVPQRTVDGDEHAWVHWVARFTGVDRDRLAKKLDALGIGSKPYYAPALHHLPWRHFAEEHQDLPVTDVLHDEVLALPMSSELSVGEAERVFWSVLCALEESGDDPR
jgi:dTDP-4-amino-4,6-dideoxygalactose transaminase/nucleoside-diphosphate-sugar epimerase